MVAVTGTFRKRQKFQTSRAEPSIVQEKLSDVICQEHVAHAQVWFLKRQSDKASFVYQ